MYTTAYYRYKKGDTVFLNGNRSPINSIEPAIHSNCSSKFIYIDTLEKDVVAMPV